MTGSEMRSRVKRSRRRRQRQHDVKEIGQVVAEICLLLRLRRQLVPDLELLTGYDRQWLRRLVDDVSDERLLKQPYRYLLYQIAETLCPVDLEDELAWVEAKAYTLVGARQ